MKNPEKLTVEDLARLILRVREMGAELDIHIRPINEQSVLEITAEEDAAGSDS